MRGGMRGSCCDPVGSRRTGRVGRTPCPGPVVLPLPLCPPTLGHRHRPRWPSPDPRDPRCTTSLEGRPGLAGVALVRQGCGGTGPSGPGRSQAPVRRKAQPQGRAAGGGSDQSCCPSCVTRLWKMFHKHFTRRRISKREHLSTCLQLQAGVFSLSPFHLSAQQWGRVSVL